MHPIILSYLYAFHWLCWSASSLQYEAVARRVASSPHASEGIYEGSPVIGTLSLSTASKCFQVVHFTARPWEFGQVAVFTKEKSSLAVSLRSSQRHEQHCLGKACKTCTVGILFACKVAFHHAIPMSTPPLHPSPSLSIPLHPSSGCNSKPFGQRAHAWWVLLILSGPGVQHGEFRDVLGALTVSPSASRAWMRNISTATSCTNMHYNIEITYVQHGLAVYCIHMSVVYVRS